MKFTVMAIIAKVLVAFWYGHNAHQIGGSASE